MKNKQSWISRTTSKEICIEFFMIVLISVLLAFSVNGVRSQGIVFFAGENGANNTGETGENGREISLEAAAQKFREGKALFADARPSEAYEISHIEGAVSLPVYEFDNWIDNFFSTTSPDTEIIAYCDGPHCSLAEDLLEKLYDIGFEKIYHIKNGLSRWEKQALPVEREEE